MYHCIKYKIPWSYFSKTGVSCTEDSQVSWYDSLDVRNTFDVERLKDDCDCLNHHIVVLRQRGISDDPHQ